MAAIWAAVRLIRAGCRGLLRELTLLAQSAGILCDSTYASLQGSPQFDLSPSELRHCPVLPAEGASAALAAAVEASLPCPLYAEEPEDAAWDASQLVQGLAAKHLAAGTNQVASRVRDVHVRTRPVYAAVLTRSMQALSGRRPIWTEGGQLYTVRYVRAQPGTDFSELLHSTPPLLCIPARYTSSGLKKARSLAASPATFVPCLAPCRNQAYWRDLANVRTELLAWMEAQVRVPPYCGWNLALTGASQGAPAGIMPTRRALRDSGARLLELAIVRRGGPDAVASELGFRARRGNHVRWEDLLRDLQHVVTASATPPGVMPSRRAFVACGRLDVYR